MEFIYFIKFTFYLQPIRLVHFECLTSLYTLFINLKGILIYYTNINYTKLIFFRIKNIIISFFLICMFDIFCLLSLLCLLSFSYII